MAVARVLIGYAAPPNTEHTIFMIGEAFLYIYKCASRILWNFPRVRDAYLFGGSAATY